MRLGEIQELQIVKNVEFGVYLADPAQPEERVLLPAKQVPEGAEKGDALEVFLYKDSQDRLIATVQKPALTLGQTAVLEVVQLGKIGAFLDWGLEKDLFLPFKEMTLPVQIGKSYPVALYIDKSSRLCATMKVYPYLSTESPYRKDDKVSGIVYEISREFGAFVAVDGRYSGLIPQKELTGRLEPGQSVQARVTAVKEDGKLDLSLHEKAYLQMDADAAAVLQALDEAGGTFPYTDKTVDPERVKQEFSMSKAAFKRAVGRLLKEGRIEITATQIRKGEADHESE